MSALRAWNRASPEDAKQSLQRCSGSERWVAEIVSSRPFASVGDLISASRATWLTLTEDEWLDVLARHDPLAVASPSSLSIESQQEQGPIYQASKEQRDRLASLVRRYEETFGFMFVTAIGGRSIDEVLEEAQKRISNSRTVELSDAVLQHQLIAEQRLNDLFQHAPVTA